MSGLDVALGASKASPRLTLGIIASLLEEYGFDATLSVFAAESEHLGHAATSANGLTKVRLGFKFIHRR